MKNWLVDASDSAGEKKIQIKLPRAIVDNQRFRLAIGEAHYEASFDSVQQTLRLYDGDLEKLYSLSQFDLEQFPSDPDTSVSFRLSNKPKVKFQAKVTPYVPGFEGRKKAGSADGSLIRSPITGKVLSIGSEEGASVSKGDCILVVEAMKMENKIFAPQSGILTDIKVQEGDSVATGAPLFTVKNNA